MFAEHTRTAITRGLSLYQRQRPCCTISAGRDAAAAAAWMRTAADVNGSWLYITRSIAYLLRAYYAYGRHLA